MKEVRYFFVPEADKKAELPQEEAQHAARVLRLEAGDEIFLMDGVGNFYRAELTLVSQKHCLYEIHETLPQEKAWRGRIHLAIAPTKNIDRIEWMAEKCTEIGWDEISFLNCKFSERKQIRTDRIEKIVVSAVKQSRKPIMPRVNELVDFKEFIRQSFKGRKYICHCYDEVEKKDLFSLLTKQGGELPNTAGSERNEMPNTANSEKNEMPNTASSERNEMPNTAGFERDELEEEVRILVGPEGDFSIDEVKMALENGYESVTLGDFRLRTETAGLMAVTMAQLAKRK